MRALIILAAVVLVGTGCASASVAPPVVDPLPTLSPAEIDAASAAADGSAPDGTAPSSTASDGTTSDGTSLNNTASAGTEGAGAAALDSESADSAVGQAGDAAAQPAPERPTIPIGVAMAQTGVLAEFDRPAIAGMQFQVDRINEQGGILGRDLVLEVRDTESRLSITQQVAEGLLREGVAALFVTCDADFARPAINEANEAGIVSISPCGADLQWDTLAFGPLAFSYGHSSFIEGFAMADRAVEMGWLTAALVVDATTPQTTDQCRGFRDRFESLGGAVTSSYDAPFDQPDILEDQLDQEPIPAVAVVALCTHLPGGLSGGPQLLDLIRARGVNTPVIVGSTLDAPGWLRSTVNPGQVTIVTPSSVFGDDPNLNVNDMVSGIGDTSGLAVRGWTVFGADAIEAFARALERTGELQGILIAQQIEAASAEELVSGAVAITAARHMQPDREFRILEALADSARVVGVRSVDSAAS